MHAVVVGAGHNGLVAATVLARAGLDVTVLEAAEVVGGAVRTEHPFAKAPEVGCSTGAYLLGVMPPELIDELGLRLDLRRRDPHYFLPTTGERSLLLGSDVADNERQLRRFFSERDLEAHRALAAEIGRLRDDVAPTWLAEPLTIEETAAAHVRPELRSIFIDLCRGSVGDYLARFGFESELLLAMYATTDGFSGLDGTWDTPGTGMNFLVHNMCRLPGADGTWMIVGGGMGAVARELERVAREAGARIRCGARVERIELASGAVRAVALEGGDRLDADVVLCGADPFRMTELVGRDAFPPEWNDRLDALARPGTTMKVNLCLRELPEFTCRPGDARVFGPTIHLLPDAEGDPIGAVKRAYAEAKAGRLPDFPTIEWYAHSTVDGSLSDAAGHHSAALFVQWVPYAIAGSSWEAEREEYVRHLLSLCDRFAPGTSAAVVDHLALAPPDIERRFGIRHGHIHHVDNSFGFADRVPYATPVEGLYAASAGCHPAGSVIGCAGRNAARRALTDLARGAGEAP